MNLEFVLSQDASDKVMAMVNAKGGEWPRTSFSCRFIEPGLVHYNDYGTVLVQKEALDKMAQSFVGKPVINEIHKEVDHKIFKDGEADGIVTRVWYNTADGWYWCDFLVWDPATRRNCESAAYSVSCAYTVSNVNSVRGAHNNIPYEQEILDGAYTHLAVVANPRYEGARIVYNSKGGRSMFLKFFKSKEDKVKNSASEIDLDTAVVEVEGKEISVKELIDIHNASEKNKAAKITIDSVIDVDGKQIAVKDMLEAYKLKNASDDDDDKKKKDKEDMENAHKKGLHNAKLENCSMCNAEDKEEKDEKEKERKNAEDKKKAEELRNAAAVRGEPQKAEFSSRAEKVAKGAEMFGTSKPK